MKIGIKKLAFTLIHSFKEEEIKTWVILLQELTYFACQQNENPIDRPPLRINGMHFLRSFLDF
ncbi:MAG: hypothetical protein COV43_04355 [Deltaproteobacteria bacterium CG11_big_fil_rev_8_21_14_0_20_42_23]|nr:MAG: hypothetical protein COV43_04355 [Deltaproteobacteria bacterium CG11_big_fil_rev_8_21_14_0_20_42_23]PJC65007.1 MAG: hypothetical protein CO021_00745 [Deltaproteobacteria bacterium CG_4_9_14_0_2_um_filter_42_21]